MREFFHVLFGDLIEEYFPQDGRNKYRVAVGLIVLLAFFVPVDTIFELLYLYFLMIAGTFLTFKLIPPKGK